MLLLNAKEAAKALRISTRLLWDLTRPRGPIPCIRLGSRVLYPVAGLSEFITRAKEGGAK
jgi:hypothetical protein